MTDDYVGGTIGGSATLLAIAIALIGVAPWWVSASVGLMAAWLLAILVRRLAGEQP